MTRHTDIRIENGVVFVHITEEGLPDGATIAELQQVLATVKDIRSQVHSTTTQKE